MTGTDALENSAEKGIIPRMVEGIFARISETPENIEFTINVSMIEIYNEKIRDLLEPAKKNLTIHENKEMGIYVQDMTETCARNENEVYSIMRTGNGNRATGSTEMNKDSSRSHSCFILHIK